MSDFDGPKISPGAVKDEAGRPPDTARCQNGPPTPARGDDAMPEPRRGDGDQIATTESRDVRAAVALSPPQHASCVVAAGGASDVAWHAKYTFLGSVASVVLLLDVTSKAWAELHFKALPRAGESLVVVENYLSFTLAYNKGGAWGLFHDFGDWIRKPFFLLVSAIAIGFIVSVYRRVLPQQTALKWGLPIILGGALGNLSDRIVRDGVVDFVDYRADWVGAMNRIIAGLSRGWSVTDHWPTFNVADIAICIGVLLMATDMLVTRRAADPEVGETPDSPDDFGGSSGLGAEGSPEAAATGFSVDRAVQVESRGSPEGEPLVRR